ncbi:MAG TPA: cation:proton antiporter [Gemmatimonadaceae bacterium]|nr:cation:proton antiporter [Gemmatimonadaceae bacterium]
MSEPGLLADLLVLFALSVVAALAFHKLRLPPIVGFLITGVVSGPYGFGLIRNVADVESLAEIGVILLLFTVGLEFSLQHLARLRRFLIIGGAAQVGITIAVTAAFARWLAVAWPVAVFLGMLVALSSTAITLRLYAERGELDTPFGNAALAILVFQDLCVVPMMLLTPALAGGGRNTTQLAEKLLEAALFIAATVVAARLVVPRVLHLVAATRRREVFLLTIVLFCLGTAWASARVGLSLALGAFIAGIVIADSEYSQQALSDMIPLREVFNSLFFISIGMLFDIRTVGRSPLVILCAIIAVVVLKFLVTAGASLALGQSLRPSVATGLGLAQIGEFSFVLSAAGTAAGLLDERLDQLFLAVAVGTMALTPSLIAIAPGAGALLERAIPDRWRRRVRPPVPGHTGDSPIADHVIIVGFGFNGRNLARVLRDVGIAYRVIDSNAAIARQERRRGEPVLYGDASSTEVLHHAGTERARVLVVAISDAAATRATVSSVRRLNPTIHVIVRTRYMREMQSLLQLGSGDVVPEEFETAIEVFTRVLRRYLVPRDVIEREVRSVRDEFDDMFRPLPDVGARVEDVSRFLTDVTLVVMRVERGAAASGEPLSDVRFRERSGATVVAIQREGGGLVASPSGDETLHIGDTVLVMGRTDQLERAATLLRGRSPT